MAMIIRMQTVHGEGVELIKYEDFVFPKEEDSDPESVLSYVRNFKYRPDDILVCTYPKCGFHMLNNILWKLKTFDFSKRPKDTVIEVGPPEDVENQEDPRIIFCELHPNRVPKEHLEKGGKMILLLRNPKDMMVSNYHYLKEITLVKNKQTWEEFFQSYINGVMPYGSYFEYLEAWEKVLKDKPSGFENVQIEVFYFEDFVKDRRGTLERLNTSLGFNRDEEYLDKVLRETTLAALRQQDSTTRRDKINEYCIGDGGVNVVYRKGVIGDWVNVLTVAQSEVVDKLMEEKVHGGVLNFTYRN